MGDIDLATKLQMCVCAAEVTETFPSSLILSLASIQTRTARSRCRFP